MKKQIFYLASAALVAGLAACSNDELDGDYSQGAKAKVLTASIEQAASTRLNLDGTTLKWAKGDAIGVFSSADGTENQQYNVDTNLSGKFTPEGGEDNAVTSPDYAYYPYEEQDGLELKRNGNVSITLQGGTDKEIIFDADNNVKMPMAGKISNGLITFNNTTALLKVTVVNMPASKTKATLTVANGIDKCLTGTATINLESNTLTAPTSSDGGKTITILSDSNQASAWETNSTQTFYFIIPADSYTSNNAGLTFALGTSYAVDDGATKTFSADLIAVKNHLYEKTLYYTSDGTLESDAVSKLNDKLADITDGGEISQNFTGAETEAGTVRIPSVTEGEPLSQITINLTNLGTGKLTLVPDKTNGKTPKKVIINTQTKAETNNAGVLDIQLPASSVELGVATNPNDDGSAAAEAAKAVTLKSVDYTTLPNILKVKSGVTVATLKRVTSGDVFVENGATVTIDTQNANNSTYYIFKEGDTATVNASNGSLSNTPAGLGLYYLIYPDADHLENTLDGNYKLLSAININVAGVKLNLNGKTLSAESSKSVIEVSDKGTLEISGATGTIQGNSVAAINIQEGGSVTLQSGKIECTASEVYGVAVEKGTFTMNGGTIKGNTTSYKAINVTDGGSVVLNSNDALGTDDATTIYGDIDIAKTSTVGTVELKKGIVKGDVSVAGSTFTLTDGTVNDIKVGTAGTVNVNGGTVNSISDTAAGTAVNIKAGTIGAEVKTAAISLTSGTPVVVEVTEDTTIGNASASAAVNITKGSLTVTEGTGVPTFQGVKVIQAIPANAGEAKVTLSDPNAIYEATDKGYVIYNSVYASMEASVTDQAKDTPTQTKKKAATLDITAGNFDGDVITDNANQFISGGKFKNCMDLYDYGESKHWFVLGYALGSRAADGYMTVGLK